MLTKYCYVTSHLAIQLCAYIYVRMQLLGLSDSENYAITIYVVETVIFTIMNTITIVDLQRIYTMIN